VNPLLVAPLGFALVGLAAAWCMPRLVHPSLCARLLVSAIGAATTAAVSALLLVALAAVGEVPALACWMSWCTSVYPDNHGASPLAGALALGGLLFAAVRVVRSRRRLRDEMAPWAGAAPLEVIPADEIVAFAVPGRPGSIIMSTSLLAALDPDEQSAVVAHERAHLDDGHHRYVRFAALCAAAFPPLVPLSRRVRFVTERWADERAAAAVGSRDVVARAIAKVSLTAHHSASASLAFGGRSTAARVDALMAAPPKRQGLRSMGASFALVGGVFVGSSVQFHHLVALVAHLCAA
jgi:hypothetical protein